MAALAVRIPTTRKICPKPARGNGGAQHQRGHAGADTDHEAPQQHQLPDLGHGKRGQQCRDHDQHADNVTLRSP